jgi:hypothetical protein
MSAQRTWLSYGQHLANIVIVQNKVVVTLTFTAKEA